MSQLDLTRIPRGRVVALARYAAAAWAQTIARMPKERCIATLVAFAHVFEAVAQDDSIDLLNQLITQCLARAESQGEEHRLHTLQDLDTAAIRMRDVCQIVLDPRCPDHKVRTRIFELLSRSQLEQDVDTVGELSRTKDDSKYYAHLLGNYSTVRRFLPALLQSIQFEAATAGQPVLKALDFLRKIEGASKPSMDKAPIEILNAAWKKLVIQADHKIDRRFYTFCALERLQDGLSRRDVYVTPSERWSDPRAKLLRGPAWEAARADVCRMLDLAPTAEPELAELSRQLDDAYRRVAVHLPDNPAFRIERVKGKERPCLTGLDKLDEPDSLIEFAVETRELVAGEVVISDAALRVEIFAVGAGVQSSHRNDEAQPIGRGDFATAKSLRQRNPCLGIDQARVSANQRFSANVILLHPGQAPVCAMPEHQGAQTVPIQCCRPRPRAPRTG